MSVSIASLQDRLRKVARDAGKDFQLILTRYFQERLLFRLSKSTYCDNFCLKGGVLLYALQGEASRPTLDLDLLSLKIRLDKEQFAAIFCEISSIGFPDDGVQFDAGKISIEEIMEQQRYRGLRIKIPAAIGNMKQLVKIDIGFGDVVTPGPTLMTYPTLLELEAPEVKVYSAESVIAEKFEAMIDLAEANSRMKDFYDIYQLLFRKQYDPAILPRAIEETFKHRGTSLRKDHPVFSDAFGSDVERNKQWENFIRRSKLDGAVTFSTVMALIRGALMP